MRNRALLSAFALAVLLPACGDSDSGTAPVLLDSGVAPLPDAAPVVSPFVPAAIEGAINQLVAACEAKALPSAQKPPIAVLLKEMTSFWSPVVIGANRMSTRLVTPSVVQAPLITDPANTDADEAAALQNAYVQSYLDTKLYKGMAYAPHATNASTIAIVNQFIAQCGPVVTIDSDAADTGRSYLIATANYQAGFTAGNKLAEVLLPGDSVMIFGTTLATWPSGVDRSRGAEEALAAQGMIVQPRISASWDSTVDTAAIQTALADPVMNIKGMVCMFSNSNNCAAAVEALGKKDLVKIVGFDMTTDTKAYFDKGYFYGIAVQRQYYMGELGVLVPYAIDVLGAATTAAILQPILVSPTFIDTGIDIITTANYNQYMTFLSELGINA